MSVITLKQYEALKSLVVNSFDVCLTKTTFSLIENSNESKHLNYIEKVLTFYLKYEPIDLFKPDVVKSITEEVFENLELYNLIFNQSIKIGLELANDEFETLDIPLYISTVIKNVQKNESRFSLIPNELLMESMVDVDMVYSLLKNNFWYTCVYLTISFITDSEFYKSLSKTGV